MFDENQQGTYQSHSKSTLLKHELEEYQCCHRRQTFSGKVSGFALLIRSFLISSSIMAARSTRSMTENRITHIVSVCADPIPGEVPASGICHMRIPVEDVDYADLLIHLPSACQFIDHALRSGGVVFVHCVQGISRSAAVVAAYCRLSIFIFQLTSFHPKHAVMWSRRICSTQALNIVRNGKRYTHFHKRC
jgi:hypothetical protein